MSANLDRRTALRSILWAAPIGFVCLVAAIRLVPEAARSIREQAEAAGEEAAIRPA